MRNIFLCVAVLFAGCQSAGTERTSQVAVGDIERAPTHSATDDKYANVYRGLDGVWEGRFDIYIDTRGQIQAPRQEKLDPGQWTRPPYKLSQSIDVRQEYRSESPYFQRVEITDTYADGRKVVSRGVNKVQGGRMYCVVKKPDDLVIHDGMTEGKDTIIWRRDRKSPLSVEYFRETVAKDTYTIIGWGYYAGDDTTKAPRLYFSATYSRP